MSVGTPPVEPTAPALVVFDLDGTITRRDTLLGYVLGFALRRGVLRALGLVTLAPDVLLFWAGKRDHGALKQALIKKILGGSSRDEIDRWNQAYIPRLLSRGVFYGALQQIERHRLAGDHLVLMTATVDLYVPALAQALGFSEWICTPIAWQGKQLDGQLLGRNVRDEEKARRLRELMARFPGRPSIAYGNSRPDLPHLRLVQHPVLINAGRSLRRAAADMNVEFRRWR